MEGQGALWNLGQGGPVGAQNHWRFLTQHQWRFLTQPHWRLSSLEREPYAHFFSARKEKGSHRISSMRTMIFRPQGEQDMGNPILTTPKPGNPCLYEFLGVKHQVGTGQTQKSL